MLLGMIVLSVSFIFIPKSKAIESTIQEDATKPGAPAIIALIGMTMFCCCYALSIGNIPWVVQSEVSSLLSSYRNCSFAEWSHTRYLKVFDQELKAIGTGSATSVNWFGNIFVSSTFLHISKSQSISSQFTPPRLPLTYQTSLVGIGPSGAFGIFGLICLFGWIFTWIYLPGLFPRASTLPHRRQR